MEALAFGGSEADSFIDHHQRAQFTILTGSLYQMNWKCFSNFFSVVSVDASLIW